MERRLDHLETEIETDVEVTRSFTSTTTGLCFVLRCLSREFPPSSHIGWTAGAALGGRV